MKTSFLFFCIGAFASFISCSKNNSDEMDHKSEIKKGEHLVMIMGCNDCHSPKKIGPNGAEIIPELVLSGYPANRPIAKYNNPMIKNGFSLMNYDLTGAAGVWGISFSANITPDVTGIGSWTEEQFKKAITEGVSKGIPGNRQLLPPMPTFASLTDDEAHALFSYLMSINPVKNSVPEPISLAKMR